MPSSVKILRHFLAPLVLVALAALILARNSRAFDLVVDPVAPIAPAPTLR